MQFSHFITIIRKLITEYVDIQLCCCKNGPIPQKHCILMCELIRNDVNSDDNQSNE